MSAASRPTLGLPGPRVISALDPACDRARALVHAFYAFLFLTAFGAFPSWRGLAARTEADLLWPVRWMPLVPWEAAVLSVGALYLAGAGAAAVFPHRWPPRLLAFLGLFQFEALANSYGKINHSNHLLVLCAFVFIFLPDPRGGETASDRKRRYLETFWGAQAVILLTYTLAGISKLRGALVDIDVSQPSLFSIDALALHIAYDFVNTGKETLLGFGEFLIAHPAVGFPLFLGATALELLSFPVAWMPRLHRLWGLGLIALHVGIGLCMEVLFLPPVFLLALFFLASPFAPERVARDSSPDPGPDPAS